ncbi:hypothetical protein Trydic_g12929 [Trypoxylus dichotomus]
MNQPRFTVDEHETDNEGMAPLDRFEHFCEDNQVLNTTNVENNNKNEVSGSGNVDINTLISAMNTLLQQNQSLMQMMSNQSNSNCYNIMPDFSKTIAAFNGDNLSQSKTWLANIETAAQLHRWPPAFKSETAKNRLEGAARHWYEAREQRLEFDEQKEQVAVGLFSREMASMIMTKSHLDVDDLYEDLVTYERIIATTVMKKDISSSSAPGQEERRDHALHAEKLHTSTGIVHDVRTTKFCLKYCTTLNCKPIHFFHKVYVVCYAYGKKTYLGYEVNVEGIRSSKDHTDAIRNYPIPKNAEQKSTDWKFGDEEMHAFEMLKSKLAEKPVLAIYSPEAETELHCDASTRGYGSILLQRQVDGKMYPTFYFSKRTTDAESKYSSYELECLAIVNSLKRFHVYLHGLKFKILTDCVSVRLTLKENTFEQILGLKQTTDPKIKEIKKQLLIKEMPFYELRNGMVFRKDKKKLTFYEPEEMEHNVIRSAHEDTTHLGVEKVTEYIRETYWFPNMNEKVKAYIDNCLKCIVYNPKYGPKEGLLHNIDKDGNNIKHILIATGVPRANGQVEVINMIVTHMLAKLCTDKKNWNKMLHEVEFALNNTVNSSTNETPSKLLFDVPQTGRVSDELRQILLDSYGNERNLEEARNEAEGNIKKQLENSKAYYDGKHKDALTYQIGDHVVIKNFNNTPGVNKKLIPKFKGPYVVKVLPNDRYEIGDPPDFQNTQIPFDGDIDSNNTKTWSKRI